MKKVLIISTHFAPDIHVGAKRPTKFAKYLPQYGWQPVILTKQIRYYHGIDETLNDELQSNLQVYRVQEWHPLRLLWSRKKSINPGRKAEYDISSSHGWMSHLRNLLDYIFFYDYSWLVPAIFSGLRLLRQHGIRLIFSTTPNPEALLVGLLLYAFTGVKWICDYRDPWTGLVTSYSPRSKMELKVSRYLEKLTLLRSDYIVTVGDLLKNDLIRLSGNDSNNRFSVICNGYDRSDFTGLNRIQKQDEKFVITFLGTWGHLVTPEFFLMALANLLRKRKYLRNKIKVNFVGEVKYDKKLAARIEEIISKQNLTNIVNRVPFVPHKTGLSYLRSSDLLLLVLGIDPSRTEGTKHRITSKIFEYLYSRKPILALIPPDGELARLIREAKAGEVINPTDVNCIEEKIYDMYKRFEKGALSPHKAILDKFDRRIQTRMLAEIFNSLIEKRV